MAPSTMPMARATSSVRWVSVSIPSGAKNDDVVAPLPHDLGVADRVGCVAMTPRGRSRTSWPWQYGQCSTSRAQRSRRPAMSGSSSRRPVARSTCRVVTWWPPLNMTRNPPLWQAVMPSTVPVTTRPP